jgi:Bromodomain
VVLVDISTLRKKLENGEYSSMTAGGARWRHPAARMLNGSFRSDVELIFDNAMTYNPPGDFVHEVAKLVKTKALKKIQEVSDRTCTSSQSRGARSYIDDEPYTYVEKNESDDDYEGEGRSKRKRKNVESSPSEDSSTRVISKPIKVQSIVSETSGLCGALTDLPICSNVDLFSLPLSWTARHYVAEADVEGTKTDTDNEEVFDELDELLSLQQLVTEGEGDATKRLTRAERKNTTLGEKFGDTTSIVYHRSDATAEGDGSQGLRKRLDLELSNEDFHESMAKLYHEATKKNLLKSGGLGSFSEMSFPPYLGHVVPSGVLEHDKVTRWEIRAPFVCTAMRWIIRGLCASGQLRGNLFHAL